MVRQAPAEEGASDHDLSHDHDHGHHAHDHHDHTHVDAVSGMVRLEHSIGQRL